MTKTFLTAVTATMALVGPAAAGNGFFLGGMADGMRDAEQLSLQRRALEQGGPAARDRLRQEFQLEAIQRAIEENNRLLEQQRMERLIGR